MFVEDEMMMIKRWWKRDVGFVLLSFFMKVDEGRWGGWWRSWM